jgi:hypothetical protein
MAGRFASSTGIYARDGARAWKLVALHDSLAVGK